MNIIAHRGWWLEPAEKNSAGAFARAFAGGFGVETDLRDHDGEIVIAHDLPVGPGLMSFDAFLELYKGAESSGVLALNIKADGLQAQVKAALQAHEISNAFVFDMAVPDALGYVRQGFDAFTRHSEYESVPAFYDLARGVWIDCFLADWITPQVIKGHLDAGKQVALVSPELHGRSYLAAWTSWSDPVFENVILCTDYPGEAQAFFNHN